MTRSIINNEPDSEQDVTLKTLTFLRGLMETNYANAVAEYLAGLRVGVVKVSC